MKSVQLCLLVAGILQLSNLHASVWHWSFDTEAGDFLTDGVGYTPGTYTLIDFVVTTSAVGGTIGSLSGGQYAVGADAFDTDLPFSFYWDGTSVVTWHHSGGNGFSWWAFDDVPGAGKYLFGWDLGNINDPTVGAYWLSNDGPSGAPALGTIAVVPEAATFSLLGLGSLALAMTRKQWLN